MDFIKQLRIHAGHEHSFTIWEFAFSLTLCVLCLSIICWTYRVTHRGSDYSQSYVQSLILTGMVTALIMIVIGSNIARAFSLVGALSIIRFRNAVKETKDVGFIFFAMAIAMACGTQFYLASVLTTLLICSIMIFLSKMNLFYHAKEVERLLKVYFPKDTRVEEVVTDTFLRLFDDFSLVSLESSQEGNVLVALFSVQPKQAMTAHQVIDGVSQINDNLKIDYSFQEI